MQTINLDDLQNRLFNRQDLSIEEAENTFSQFILGIESDVKIAAF